MISAAEIHQQLLARAAGTPYTVTTIPGGLLVHLDVADMQWMTLIGARGLSKEYSIELMLDESSHVYRKEQIIRGLTWRAGLQPGTFVPEISGSRSVQRGTMIEVSGTSVLGLDRAGHLGVQGYSLDSREMSAFVDQVMEPSGWTKKMDRSTRIGLIVALSAVGGILVAGLITLIVLLIVL
jgi:hypothetical protein